MGTQVFFDHKEVEISDEGSDHVSKIPKLKPHWKIQFQFRPFCTNFGGKRIYPVSMRVFHMKQLLLKIDFPSRPPHTRLVHGDAAPILGPAPPSGEWSKILVSYEKSEQEEGKATLALALSDEEVGRVEVDEVKLDSGIKIFIGPESAYSYDMDTPEGYISGLIVAFSFLN